MGLMTTYKSSQTNMARMKLEGQLDVVEFSRNTVPDSVNMGDPAGGYVEMLKARNSVRGHLMAWSKKKAMQEHLQELTESSNLKRKEYGTVMSSGTAITNILEGCSSEILRQDHECTWHTHA